MDIFSSPDLWVAFLTLFALELVLGIDNIVFISILTNRLPEHERPRARIVGLTLAMVMRILLLLAASAIIGLTGTWFSLGSGTAFQISDDIIDIDSDPDESGKLPGTDLREGVHTLPVLYALRETGPDTERLRELLAGPIEDDAKVAEALALLRASSGIALAKETVAEYAARARDELALLPDLPGRVALGNLVDYTINRHG